MQIVCESDYLRPSFAKPGDAGMDLKASIGHKLYPGERALIPTGIKIALPFGTVGFVCPRSGLALKKGITVLNAPGVVDAGYRGEIGVVLFNASEDPFVIQSGDRIAQLLVLPVLHPSLEFVESLDDTERGEGGFGSTGV